MKPTKEDFHYPPILCSRILQTLDSERRFGEPYGTQSPFSFAFRDIEFRKPGNRSYKFYMALRRCKDIKEYRQQVVELYQDCDIEIEVNGESRKLPIQMLPIPQEMHKILKDLAAKNKYPELPPQDVALVFLATLPSPRLLGVPPTGRYRSEFLTKIVTNKIIDLGLIVSEIDVDLGIKHLGAEISKQLSRVESTISFTMELAKRLKSFIPKPVGIALRGSMADNPVVCEDAFRVPAACDNFWESRDQEYWPTVDLDLDFFCGSEDFVEIFEALKDPSIYVDFSANLIGLRMVGVETPVQFLVENSERYVDIYVMTDEWALKSIQRHLNLGLEQPWAYYYASSYPLLFEKWGDFMNSIYTHIHY